MAKAESLYLQGTEAYRKGDFDAALTACESLLAQNPAAAALPAILNLKALILAGKGLLFAAADCIGQAIEMKADDALLRHHAARILLELGRTLAARQAAEHACRLAPKHTGYRYHLARVYLREGLLQEAEQSARQCVQEDPGVFEAWILLSELAVQHGDEEQATACLEEITRQDAGHARALALHAATTRDGETEPSVQQALEQVRTGAQDIEDRATATFALADIARRAGKHPQAFAYYREANDRLAAANPFAMDAWEQGVEKTIAASRAWLEDGYRQSAGAGAGTGEKLVFIVGMPRSGTSLCEQIISAHPGVLGAGELTMMEHIEKALAHAGIDPFGMAREPAWVEKMRSAYLDGLPPGWTGHSRISDKTPRNFERLGLIFRLFPAARVLWCVRHPLDTTMSCYFQDFGVAQRFSNRLDHCARMYIGQVRLMRHWKRYFGHSIHTVDYSSLVQNLEENVVAMAEFLDLPFDPAMLQPHGNPRMVWTASSEQVRRPVYTTSLNNWRHYRQELTQVCAVLRQQGLLDEQGRSTVLDF